MAVMDAREATLALLAARAPEATVCPSEVARALAAAADWRDRMPAVHAAVDRLVAEGLVRLMLERPVPPGPGRPLSDPSRRPRLTFGPARVGDRASRYPPATRATDGRCGASARA